MTKAILILLVLLALLAVGCEASPTEKAKANAMNTETYIKEANADLDLEIRRANAQAQIDAQRAKIDNDKLRAEAEAASIVETERLKAVAEQGAITARGQAVAKLVSALGFGGQILLSAIGIGLAVAAVLYAAGRSAAYAINSVLAAQYVRIGVESQTMLPPPLVYFRNQGQLMLTDTRTGITASVKDGIALNRLLVAATAQSTNAALLGRAAVEISKANRGKGGDGVRAAESLPTIAASIPMLDTGEEE